MKIVSSSGNVSKTNRPIEGVKTLIKRRFEETTSSWSKEWYNLLWLNIRVQLVEDAD